MIIIYDLRFDRDREITQEDVDKLQRTESAFSQLIKTIKFHLIDLRDKTISRQTVADDIEAALCDAENSAGKFELHVEPGIRNVRLVDI